MTHCPILLLVFNRPDATAKVFAAIRKVKPRQLFVAADGPRPGRGGEGEACRMAREIIGGVDWECDVKRLYRDTNLGCKIAVSSAITWFFQHVDRGIILEDDCLPSETFFPFCAELLERYADDERVMMISGNNFQNGVRRGDASYYFSRIPHIWGWATWRRAWVSYGLEMETFPRFIKEGGIKNISQDPDVQRFWLSNLIGAYEGHIDTWDFQWMYAMFAAGGLSICPQVNMVSNIGFGECSTHTTDAGSRFSGMERHDIGNLIHPDCVKVDTQADAYVYREVCDVSCHSKGTGLRRWRKLVRRRQRIKRLVNAFEARNGIGKRSTYG